MIEIVTVVVIINFMKYNLWVVYINENLNFFNISCG